MTEFRVPRVEPLAAHHDRKAFSCGEKALDDYLRTQAGQDARRNVASAFVAIGDAPEAIIGYYTLSAASFSRDDIPEELARKLPRYPIPAALIGRLAVDRRFQGRGYGRFLLINALDRIMRASEALAIHAVVVDPFDDAAQSFYAFFGFRSLEGPQRRMFLALPRRK